MVVSWPFRWKPRNPLRILLWPSGFAANIHQPTARERSFPTSVIQEQAEFSLLWKQCSRPHRCVLLHFLWQILAAQPENCSPGLLFYNCVSKDWHKLQGGKKSHFPNLNARIWDPSMEWTSRFQIDRKSSRKLLFIFQNSPSQDVNMVTSLICIFKKGIYTFRKAKSIHDF